MVSYPPPIPDPPESSREDLDEEITAKLANILARQWGSDDHWIFISAAAAYGVMRQVKALADLRGDLRRIGDRLDAIGGETDTLAVALFGEEANG